MLFRATLTLVKEFTVNEHLNASLRSPYPRLLTRLWYYVFNGDQVDRTELQKPVNFTIGKLRPLCWPELVQVFHRWQDTDTFGTQVPIRLRFRTDSISFKGNSRAARLVDTLGLESVKRSCGWPANSFAFQIYAFHDKVNNGCIESPDDHAIAVRINFTPRLWT